MSQSKLRYVGVIRSRYANDPLIMYLTSVWLGEDQTPNTTKTHVKKEIELHFKFY
jgi:hypothetical protein